MWQLLHQFINFLMLFLDFTRSRNGFNNYSTELQFTKINGEGGNCRVLNTTTVLSVTSSNLQIQILADGHIDMSSFNKNSPDVLSDKLQINYKRQENSVKLQYRI